ncbi:F0F1 ATP synthase subunit gamma [Paenibacillus albiflavus]|uniref:ATP synthase gamma chain n=1 Tax=Paenibacillus albiflavus TaxID=2545760 RepID=A0A4R4DX89_9BACL|nr:ATP synthase F1 subunit gamma [Paenibacillus albiflavus]TCZ69371.1 F0F1 ATP synthase subunit gamma [Paenibacillus albiflavus]
MAKGMRDIKRQIKSTQNSKQITKAMEMVAASKLRRAQDSAEAARPYAEKMKEVVASIASGTKGIKHPMLMTREIKKTGYLIITSDRGLAGGYNANLLRMVVNMIKTKHKSADEYAIYVLGRKGRDFLRKRKFQIASEVIGIADTPVFADIKAIANEAVSNFENGSFDELYVVYNEFVNVMTQIPVSKRLLPLEDIQSTDHTPSASYEYEPSAEEVLAVLLPKYAETMIYSALMDAKAGEFGARMTAMGSASKNADQLISSYTLQYNRARQAAITQEISEIVAGANA